MDQLSLESFSSHVGAGRCAEWWGQPATIADPATTAAAAMIHIRLKIITAAAAITAVAGFADTIWRTVPWPYHLPVDPFGEDKTTAGVKDFPLDLEDEGARFIVSGLQYMD